MKPSYQKTMYACFVAYIVQAVVNCFAPLLFVTFQNQYSIPLAQITALITINFAVQLAVDLLSTGFVDRIGYRAAALLAHGCAAVGLVGLAILPDLLARPVLGPAGGGLHLRHRRRADRGAGQPHHRSLPHRQQGGRHEPAALLLLLGPHGCGAVVHRLFRAVWHRELEAADAGLGSTAHRQRDRVCQGPHPDAGCGRRAGADAGPAAAPPVVLGLSCDDALRRRQRAGRQPVGLHLRRAGAGRQQDGGRPGRADGFCPADGHPPGCSTASMATGWTWIGL